MTGLAPNGPADAGTVETRSTCRGAGQRCRSRPGAVLAVLSISLLLAALDTTALNVALPSVGRALSASPHQLQWIVDAYVLVYGSLLLTAGRIADRAGRRRIMIAGLAVFALASTLAATSHSIMVLIAMRAAMGIGGATLTPTTLAILHDVFRDPRKRAVAVATWSAALGLGVAIGPLVGGALLHHFWWGSVFLINVPVALVAILGALILVPESADPAAPRIDLPGATLSFAGIAVALWGIIEAPRTGWTSPQTFGALTAAAVLLAVFVAVEGRSRHPMLSLALYRNRNFSVASAVSMLSFFTVFAVLYVLTLYLQLVLGYSPLAAGVRILPAAATIMVSAPLSALVARWIGSRATATLGLLLLAGGSAWLAGTSASSRYDHVLQALVPFGIGFGFALAPIVERVLGSLPPERVAVGSAANSTAEQVGGALGVAVVGSVLATVADGRLTDAARAVGIDSPRLTFATARAVAEQLPAPLNRRLLDTLNESFAAGMHPAFAVAAATSLAAAVLVVAYLPSERAHPPSRPRSPAP